MIRVNKGFQVCREIPASKETREVRVCQDSRVPGGSQGLWAELETKAQLGFLGLLALRVSQETSDPLETMALKVPRGSLEPEACRGLLGSWDLREMRDPQGHQGSLAWRVSLVGRGFLEDLVQMV